MQRNALAIQDMIRNQLVVFAAKEVTTHDSVQIVLGKENLNDPNASKSADVKLWNSNGRNMREHVKNDIRSTLIQRGFFDINGNINKDKFKDLSKKIDAISEKPKPDHAKELQKVLFEELGIAVPVGALTIELTKDSRGRQIFRAYIWPWQNQTRVLEALGVSSVR